MERFTYILGTVEKNDKKKNEIKERLRKARQLYHFIKTI
jgi:hypothetical protein